MPLRVVCVGAGIASLSAAIALREHANITLLEAADSEEGMNTRAAGLTVYACGANILRDSLGLDPIRDIQAVRGKSVAIMNWKDGSRIRDIIPSEDDWYMAHRGSLLNALLKKATGAEGKGRPPELLLGKVVTELDVEAGRVTTSDGAIHEADLIIGGDGVRSVTRKAVVDKTIVQPSGLSVYRWLLQPGDWDHLGQKDAIDALVGPEARHIVVCDTNDMRLVTYRCHASGLVNGAVILPDYRLPYTTEDWLAAGSVEHMQSIMSDLAEPLKSIVGCVKTCGLWQLRKQAPLENWHKGKAIILGDAAHPMLPFQASGGAMALEDAEALQYSLGEIGWDAERVTEALERTFCLRFLRASLVQHFSDSSSFGPEVMSKAFKWSLERATGSGKTVPLDQQGANDAVQKMVAEKIDASAGGFDVRGTSDWIMNYKSAAEFEKSQPEYVLTGSLV